MAQQEEDRRHRQAAVNVKRILASQQEGERRYMEQQAAQQEAERRIAAQQAAQQVAEPLVFPISSSTDTPMTFQQVDQYGRDFFGEAFSGIP